MTFIDKNISKQAQWWRINPEFDDWFYTIWGISKTE